jgi:TRAP-type mannitol/chloroaromatic compound transport system permease small subunit
MSASYKFLPIYVALGGAYALLHKAHVNADIIYSRLSVRGRSIVDLVTATLFFIFTIMLLVFAIPDAKQTIGGLHFSFKLFNPLNWPEMLFIAIGIILLFLQGLAKFIRDFMIAITGKEVL